MIRLVTFDFWDTLVTDSPATLRAQRTLRRSVEASIVDGDRRVRRQDDPDRHIELGAQIAAREELRHLVVAVHDQAIERTQLLRMYGAEIVYSPGNLGSNGAVEVAHLASMMAAELGGRTGCALAGRSASAGDAVNPAYMGTVPSHALVGGV